MLNGKLKCSRCKICNGAACKGTLPGLGGVFEGKNCLLNFEGWEKLRQKAKENGQYEKLLQTQFDSSCVRCAPVTGAIENVGCKNEEDFYFPYFKTTVNAGFEICVGDGCPDEKLLFGIEAVKKIRNEGIDNTVNSNGKNDLSDKKAAFFFKPYPDEILKKRADLARPFANYIGIDIDAYNIVTMRNKVHLEKKTAAQLKEFRKYTGLPFVLKGVFTAEDLELVRQLEPDVAFVSNHGGRVETNVGSSAEFLAEHAEELKKHCSESWVDGGIRTKLDVQTAIYYGAKQVAIARPLIRAAFDEVPFELK